MLQLFCYKNQGEALEQWVTQGLTADQTNQTATETATAYAFFSRGQKFASPMVFNLKTNLVIYNSSKIMSVSCNKIAIQNTVKSTEQQKNGLRISFAVTLSVFSPDSNKALYNL